LREDSATLSSNLSVIQTRIDFTTDMVNTLKEGADKLTLADINEEGANMLMLQTRQQFGYHVVVPGLPSGSRRPAVVLSGRP
jgi:flagellin